VPQSAILGTAKLNGVLWRMALSPLLNPPSVPPLPLPPPHVTPPLAVPRSGARQLWDSPTGVGPAL
jgi:hypothetical protein